MAKKDKSDNTKPQAEEWQQKADEYLAGWQRAQADLVNYRKRAEEEKSAFAQFAHADLITQLLPVLDNFKRAAHHVPDQSLVTDGTVKNWIHGVTSIEKQLEMILQNNGITQVPVVVGDAFDPNIHEAVATEVSDQGSDIILAEVDPGYLLHGKVLRPAKVKVSS